MTASVRGSFFAAVLIFALSMTAIEAQAQRGGARGPVAVTAATAERKEFSDVIEALGTARANETVTISAKLTETVREVLFEDGQMVKKDDVLVILDSAEEAANLKSALALVAERRTAYNRAKGLEQQQIVSRATYEEKQAALRSAEAGIQSIKSRINDAYIRAPFDGVLGFRNISVGALVRPGDLVTTIDDLTQMKIDFDVPALYLQQLKPGIKISGTVDGFEARVFEGSIATIETQVDPVTRSVRVRAIVPNPDMALRPGLLMNVKLFLNPREALVVPEAALVQQRDKTFVYTLHDENGKTVTKKAEIVRGARRLGEVEVISGLEAGARVVIDGTMMVQDGQEVTIRDRMEGQ